VLQVTERALNSGTATVEGAEPFGVSRDARAERRGLAPISAGRGEPEKDGGEDQEDDADARRVRVKSTMATARNRTPASALPIACFDMSGV
jgi:hypothetical protein